jgi:hypothetical protein
VPTPTKFRSGDVVRSGEKIGVVLTVIDYSEDANPPMWELHVDAASPAEARQLRLRGLE